MLRQGKAAVQALHEVEVLTTDYVGEDTLLTSTDLGQRSSLSPMTVHTIVRGRLHIRTGNIGMLHVFEMCFFLVFLLLKSYFAGQNIAVAMANNNIEYEQMDRPAKQLP